MNIDFYKRKTINILILSILLFCKLNGVAQKENFKWYFGINAGIDFTSAPPTTLLNSNMVASWGCNSFSDSTGKLLFYSNGEIVFNNEHVTMLNGSGLAGNANAYQSVIAVQSINDDSTYFLFTVDYKLPQFVPPANGLRYSIINLRLDNGKGGIEDSNKNINIPGASYSSNALSGTRHENNKFVWIVTRINNPDSNFYASYLVNNEGLDTVPVYSPSLIPISFQIASEDSKVIKISPDGTKIACGYNNIVEYGTFDPLSGSVTPLFTFIPIDQTFGPFHPESIEFSVDSKFIYVSNRSVSINPNCIIFQYNALKTDSTEFVQSEYMVGTPKRAYLQNGPDNKIYGTLYNKDSLCVINFPTLNGSASGFQNNVISLEGHIGGNGLPQYIQKYKGYIHSTGNCAQSPIHFSGDIWPPADTIRWNFGDPASGTSNISYDTTPVHVYTTPGQYTIELYVRHIDNRTDTSWVTISINETPDPDLGPDQTICQGDSITLDAGTCTGCTFEWSSIPPGFSSTEQAVTLLQAGIYIVAVSSTNGCTGRDTIQLTVTAPPIITNSSLFISICSGEATSIPLTSNLPGTSFSWNATSSSPSIIGFGPGTGDTIDQLLSNTGTSPETVTYTITPYLGDCAGDSVEYVITVTPGDSVLVSISASDDSICQGTQISYVATPTHGGSAPSYQWKVNGVNQGTNNSLFNYTPSNDDTVCCILSSSDTVCISNNPTTSNEIIMTVYPVLQVIISIATTNNPVCEVSTATFLASTSNKGNSPNFQWVVNGNPVGTNDSIFINTPSNGDQVYCILTSSEQCTSNNPASSDTITMIINPLLPVGISISASNNPVCQGLPVTFTATPVNGGVMPAYQWQVNGINVGTNNPDLTFNPANGDHVTCRLTSNAECITNNPATSNSIPMSVGEAPDVSFAVCFDTVTTLNAKPFKLKGGVPLGGTYSGPGVDQVTDYFNPAMAGLGVKTINYLYTNQFNCSNQSSRIITVINTLPFICGDTLIDIRDNQHYPTIQIGTQCWLAVNLNHGQQIGGSSAQRDNCLVEKFCYNDLPANCTQYGALYQWDELMRYENTEETQGLCPPGWHVPSEADWQELFDHFQGSAFAGSPLLSSGYSGFNAMLSGIGLFNKEWYFSGFATLFWSSTSHGANKAWAHGLNEYNYSVSYYPSYRSNAFSVRCISD